MMKNDQFEESSHIKESCKNFISLSFVQILTFVLGLISRGVFLRTLGNEYLGVSGLFSSLLLVLSLSEFGVGEALTYAYIQAFAKKNNRMIKDIFFFSKRLFRVIALSITIIGFALMTLIPFLIRESTIEDNLYVFYLFFLFNNIFSYFVGPYSAVYSANQRVRVISSISFVTLLIVTILQIISLIIYASYYIYLSIMLAGNMVTYFLTRKSFNRDYKWIYDSNYKPNEFDEIRNLLVNRMKDTFVVKLSGTIMEGIDNICISRFFGVALVGKYNNYTVIKGTLRTVAKNIYTSIFSSVGIINARMTEKHREELYSHILFIFHFLGATFSVCLFVLINDFIPLWLDNSSILPINVTLVIAFDLYINILQYAPSNFVQTTNVLHFVRVGFILTAICNLILSIILGLKYGIIGVIIATPISRLLFCVPSYVKNLYYHVFKENALRGWKLLVLFICQAMLIGCIDYYVLRMLPADNIGLFIIKSALSFWICVLLLIIFNYRSDSLKIIYKYTKNIFVSKFNKRR